MNMLVDHPVTHLSSQRLVASASAIKSVSALMAIDEARHRWFFVKEAFAPDVVRHAMADANVGGGDLVVDPFCGSGTVPLQAAIEHRPAAGIEVNPFLAFVTRTKLLQCDPSTLEAAAENLVHLARRGTRRSPLEGYSTFSKTPGAKKWLFAVPVLRAFETA